MPLYFAYGANMDIAGMAKRAPGSKPLGIARLPRHRFIIMREGYASIVRDPRAAVWGLLWDLALADLRPLDRFEGIDRGLYTKINQPVIVEAAPAKAASGLASGDEGRPIKPSGAKRALVYVGTSSEPGRPKAGYLEGIIGAAQALDLPAAHIAELRRWQGGSPVRRAEKAAGPVSGVTPTRTSPAGLREAPKPDWNWEG